RACACNEQLPASAASLPTCGWDGRRVKSRILLEHASLELLQHAAGLEPELVAQPAGAVLVGVKRLGLTARAVEREHHLLEKMLLERIRGDERSQLGDKFAVARKH